MLQGLQAKPNMIYKLNPGAIVNADVNASAAIAQSKLALNASDYKSKCNW